MVSPSSCLGKHGTASFSRTTTGRRGSNKNYQIAFYTAAVLAGIALLCELIARRPAVPESARVAVKVTV